MIEVKEKEKIWNEIYKKKYTLQPQNKLCCFVCGKPSPNLKLDFIDNQLTINLCPECHEKYFYNYDYDTIQQFSRKDIENLYSEYCAKAIYIERNFQETSCIYGYSLFHRNKLISIDSKHKVWYLAEKGPSTLMEKTSDLNWSFEYQYSSRPNFFSRFHHRLFKPSLSLTPPEDRHIRAIYLVLTVGNQGKPSYKLKFTSLPILPLNYHLINKTVAKLQDFKNS